jgi:hypothetical protein
MKRDFAESCLNCSRRPYCEIQALEVSQLEKTITSEGVEILEGTVLCAGFVEGDKCKARFERPQLASQETLSHAQRVVAAAESIENMMREVRTKQLLMCPSEFTFGYESSRSPLRKIFMRKRPPC